MVDESFNRSMDDSSKFINNVARTALAQGSGVAVSKGFAKRRCDCYKLLT